MTFLHRGQTQAQVVSTLHRAIYNPLPRSNRYFLLVSETQVIITFAVCAYMLAKKNSLGKLWLMTRRDSPYGTFWVSNAVFMLVTTVTTYLVAWGIMALVVPIFSIVNISSLEWWWVVPLPWWPLVTGAYISIHGFAVGCSPRSPLSAINMHLAAPQQRQRRIYLPIPKRPLIVNGALILPCIIFAITSFFFVGLSGHAYYHAKSLRTVLLAPDINTLVTAVANHGSEALNFPGADLLASDDLVFAGRKLAAAYMDVHRLVCVNLTIFAVAAFSLFVPCVIYGLPNIVSLVDHACSQHPAPLPADCTNVFRKIRFLLTEGRPISSKGRNTLSHQMQKMNLETWKMTFLAVVYMLILTVCVPSFGMLPIMIIAVSFPTEVAQGDVGNVLGLALTMVSLVSFMSCTFVAIFCTVATLDPLFRAAIGLNMIRTRIAIDIKVVHHQSRHEEGKQDSSRLSTSNSEERLRKAAHADDLELGERVSFQRSLTLQPSMTTLKDSSSSDDSAKRLTIAICSANNFA